MNLRKLFTFLLAVIMLITSFEYPIFAIAEPVPATALAPLSTQAAQAFIGSTLETEMRSSRNGTLEGDFSAAGMIPPSGLVAMNRAVPPLLTGTYQDNSTGTNFTIVLNTQTGQLDISGKGKVVYCWTDSSGNQLGSYIKKVTLSSGITSIESAAFAQCKNLASISIPSTVKYIGELAFYQCSSLKSITIPSSVTKIDNGAFMECPALTTVSMSSKVTLLGHYAFMNCNALKAITLPSTLTTIGEQAFVNCNGLTEVSVPASVKRLEFGVFAQCQNLKKVTLHEGLTYLGDSAFFKCIALDSINFPNSLTAIDQYCFSMCPLTNGVILPQTLQSLGAYSFAYCTGLASINLPASLATMGDECFANCTALQSVTLPDNFTGGLSQIPYGTFSYCSKLNNITIPEGIIAIGEGAFACCDALSKVELPSSVTEIAAYAFSKCASLEKINLPQGLTIIREQTFFGCSSLKNIAIPRGVAAIEPAAFYECRMLSDISLPQSLQIIGSHAFAFCEKLDSITLPDGLKEIGNYALSSTGIYTLTIPQGVTVLAEGLCLECPNLRQITLHENLTAIKHASLALCSSLSRLTLPDSLTELGEYALFGCTGLRSLVIPDGITEIANYVLAGCEGLVELTLPSSCTAIGDYSLLSLTSLTSLHLPQTLKTIGDYALNSCPNLQELSLPDSLISIGECALSYCSQLKTLSLGSQLTSLGNYAFASCPNLQSITVSTLNPAYTSINGILYTKATDTLVMFPPANTATTWTAPANLSKVAPGAFYQCTKLTSVTLSSSMDEIPDHFFYGCSSLESVTIPSGVRRIGDYAFTGCAKLKSVNISDTSSSIGVAAFFGCSSLTSLHLPTSMTSIPDQLLTACSSLQSIELPPNLTSIGDYAFAHCSALTSLQLPETLTAIGTAAFAECDSLTSLVLPEKIESISNSLLYGNDSLLEVKLTGDVFGIGTYAFENSVNLTDVYFSGNAPEAIGDLAFSGTSEDLVLHINTNASGWSTPAWTGPDGLTYQTGTAYSGACGKTTRWQYSTHDKTLTISGTGSTYSWKNSTATPWAAYLQDITTVIIEEGVTSLGGHAFEGCFNLTSVQIPQTMTSVGYAAFAECRQLNTVIGQLNASAPCLFYNCIRLQNILLGPELAKIDEYAFFGCSLLQEISIPASVKTIHEGAFAECRSLASVTLEGTPDSINTGAFINCLSLTELRVQGEWPVSVHEYAFYGLTDQLGLTYNGDSLIKDTNDVEYAINSVVSGELSTGLSWSVDRLNATLTISGSGAIPDFSQGGAPWYEYEYCIHTIRIENGVTSIGNLAFSGLTLASKIEIPDSVTKIGNYAFSDCSALTTIALPSSLTTLGEGAFASCILLESAPLPASLHNVPAYAFYACVNLVSAGLHPAVESIGYGAYYMCTSMTTLGEKLYATQIDGWAFAYCLELNHVTVSGALHTLGEYAFYCCQKLSSVDISSAAIQEICDYAFSQTALTSISLPSSVSTIGKAAFELCESLEAVRFSSAPATIKDSAFYGCAKLTSFDFDGVARIESKAFAASGLKQVHLPASVSTLNAYAFADCASLPGFTVESGSAYHAKDGVLYQGATLIQYPAGKSQSAFEPAAGTTAIAEGAFYGTRKLERLILSDEITSISSSAFVLCEALTEVSIGRRITSIPYAAFASCINLSNVLFCGDAPTSIGTDAFFDAPLTIYYLPDAAGWSDSTWTGPDGLTYTTRCAQSRSIELAAPAAVLNNEGMAAAAISVYNRESTPLTITSVTTSDSEFEVIWDPQTAIIQPGETYSGILVQPVNALDNHSSSSCTVIISCGMEKAECVVEFLPTTTKDIRLSVAESSTSTIDVTIGVVSLSNQLNTMVALAVYRGNEMLSSHLTPCTLENQQQYQLTFSVDGKLQPGDSFEVMLLDSTFAPVADAAKTSCSSAIASGYATPYIELKKSAVQDLPQIFSASRASVDPALVLDTLPRSGLRISRRSGSDSAQTVNFSILLTTQRSNPVSFVGHKIVYDEFNINEVSNQLLKGEIPDIGSSQEKSSPVSYSATFGTTTITETFKKGELAKQDFQYFDDTISGTTTFGKFDFSSPISANPAGAFQGTTYKPPSFSQKVGASFTFVETTLDAKDFQISGHKFRVEGKLEAGKINGEVSGEADITAGAEIGAEVNLDVANAEATVSWVSEDGESLFDLTFGGGVGASASASGEFNKDNVKLTVGAKLGIGGKIGLNVHPAAMGRAIMRNIDKTLQDRFIAHVVDAYKREQSGEENRVASCIFIMDSITEETLFFSPLLLPSTPISAVTSQVLKAALPKSNGGTAMPKDPAAAAGGGNTGTGNKAPSSSKSEDEKLAALKQIASTLNSTQLLIALMRINMFHMPIDQALHGLNLPGVSTSDVASLIQYSVSAKINLPMITQQLSDGSLWIGGNMPWY